MVKPDDVSVVVVDDSAVVRRVVSAVIRRTPGLTVAGTAADGREAVKVVGRLHPDIVVLDVEMPVLDGLGALRELKRNWPRLPVIMFSTLTESGAVATLQALAEGADDYLTKAISSTGPAGAFDAVSEGLVPLLLAWGAIARSRTALAEVPGRGGLSALGTPTPPKAALPEAPLPEAPLAEAALPQAPVPEAPLAEAPLAEAPVPEAPLAEAALPTSPPPSPPLTSASPVARSAPATHPREAATRAPSVQDLTARPLTARPFAAGDLTAQARARATTPVRAAGPRLAVVPGTTAAVAAVVVGSSTGGPNALGLVVPSLPADLQVPVFVVQHMPPTFTRLLAERLDSQSTLRVHEAAPGMVAYPGHLYVAPGGSHMVVRRAGREVVIGLDDGPPENSCRPSVDVLFRSAAATWGAGVLAVVLTGMGQDGLIGCRSVIAEGGTVIAQDEASSVVWGMPGAVVRAGLPADVTAIGDIAASIVRRVRRDETAKKATAAGGRPGQMEKS